MLQDECDLQHAAASTEIRPERRPFGRRVALRALGAGLGAAGAIALGQGSQHSATAATGGNFILGQINDAADTTKLKQSAPGSSPDPVLEVEADTSLAVYAHSNGIGISGTGSIGVNGASNSSSLPGVLGMNNGGGPGVRGSIGSSSAAIEGHNSGAGPAVYGNAAGSGPGVKGTSAQSPAVWGESSGAGPGILGNNTGTGPGIRATHSGAGFALEVDGTARFMGAAGAGTIPAKTDSGFVSNSLVSAASHISVALTADPGSSAVVQWIERSPGSGFTLHLSAKANNATVFTYLIVEP
jgi:hypothetical protein